MAWDLWGVDPAGRIPITCSRILGAAIIMTAALLAVAPSISGSPVQTELLLILPFSAGLLNGLQTVMNGIQTVHCGNFVPATFLNFAIGLVGLAVIILVRGLIEGSWVTPPTTAWLYLGGPLGVLIVGGASALVKHLGALLTSLGVIAGQLIGALVLDLVCPSTELVGFPWLEAIGTIVAILGIFIASRPPASHPVSESNPSVEN